MEINEDGTKFQYYSYRWKDIDPATGLAKLDEGLYFHFKNVGTGVSCSVRTKRWWGTQTIYRKSFSDTEVDPAKLLLMSAHVDHYFNGSEAHVRYKAAKARKDTAQAKYMGSYDKRNVHEVDRP